MIDSPPTVLDRILAQARQRPEAVALRRCDGTSAIRYKELASEVDRLAGDLRSQEVSRGSRVIVISDNGPETYLSLLACAKLGAIAVMVDGNLPAATIERFGQITEPRAILIAPASRIRASDLPDALKSIPVTTVAIAPDPEDFAPALAAEGLVANPDLGADDPLAMIFTSGTTGEPKAVLLANRTFYAVADILQREQLTWVTWVVGEATYSPLPATHIGGLWWIVCHRRRGRIITTGNSYR